MLIQFALSLVVLLGFCGLALDAGLLELKQLQLQNAADAAALGAMYGMTAGLSTANWQASGNVDAALNGFTNNTDGVTIAYANPPNSGPYAGNKLAVQATISQAVHPIFIPDLVTLTAQATSSGSVSVDCLYAFSRNSGSVASLSIVNSTLKSTCPFYLGLSYNLNSGSSSSGAQYQVAGSASASASSAGSVSPNPIFNVAKSSDPLSYIAAPTFNSCDHTGQTYSNMQSATLTQGTYCGGIQANGVNLTLQPGTYILTGATTINGGSITGSGVTIYMTQGGGWGFGTMQIENLQVQLSAPTSGALQGILFFSDRSWQTGVRELQFTGDNSISMDGILYTPGIGIYMSQCQTVQTPHYLNMVADTIDIENSQQTSINNDYSTLTGGNPFRSGSAGLVQ